jgi:hypothetical protein
MTALKMGISGERTIRYFCNFKAETMKHYKSLNLSRETNIDDLIIKFKIPSLLGKF